jgi:hypothetical protein
MINVNSINWEKVKVEFPEMYEDFLLNNPEKKDRYVAELLHGEQDIYNKLSPDAREVLDFATELLNKSFKERRMLHLEHPEYHLQTWDAGYAQLKLVWKKYFPDDFRTFRAKYKAFEDRMRPLVYELGFLLK